MLRILVVDDNKTIQKLISALLLKAGHNVVGLASDGEEGVHQYKSLRPDIVLLDITMPNQDGRETLTQILSHGTNTKVIMCSALKSDDIIKECLSLGAAGFIEKEKLKQDGYLMNELKKITSMQLSA